MTSGTWRMVGRVTRCAVTSSVGERGGALLGPEHADVLTALRLSPSCPSKHCRREAGTYAGRYPQARSCCLGETGPGGCRPPPQRSSQLTAPALGQDGTWITPSGKYIFVKQALMITLHMSVVPVELSWGTSMW